MGNAIIEFLRSIVSMQEVFIILGMCAGQLFAGTFAAMIRGDFDVQEFGRFYRKVAMYFAIYIGAGTLGNVVSDWAWVQPAAFGVLCGIIADKILKGLNDAGIPVPDGLPLLNNVANSVGLIPGVRLLAERADKARKLKE